MLEGLHKISALAIVDDQGRLLGDLSADNLRKLSIHNFKRLYQPVDQMGDMARTHSLPFLPFSPFFLI